MATGTSKTGDRPSAVALGPTPDTYSVHDKVLTQRMTLADLARVRAEILGEEEAPAEEIEEVVEIDVEPDPEPVRPAPPPLPPQERLAAIRRRVATHDYGGALLLAEALVADEPENAAAQRCVATCRTTLENVYLAQLGSRAEVPRIILSSDKLRTLNPDRWAAFIISRVDGMSSIDDIIDIAGMPQLDALRILYELLQQGVIGLASMNG